MYLSVQKDKHFCEGKRVFRTTSLVEEDAKLTFSLESIEVPGLVIHFRKHLSVIDCSKNIREEELRLSASHWRQTNHIGFSDTIND